MKLYQLPNGVITTVGPFFSGETKTMKEVGDTKDGWVINTGTMPPKDALVEVQFREGRKAAAPRPADCYYWHHEDQTGDIMAYRIIAPTPKPTTFSEIKVTVELTVTKVDTRSCGTTMFSTDCPEWFEAHDAIGYVAPPRPKIEAGQVRRVGHCKIDYLILVTPAADDRVVVGRADGPDSNPVLLERPAVEAAQVVS